MQSIKLTYQLDKIDSKGNANAKDAGLTDFSISALSNDSPFYTYFVHFYILLIDKGQLVCCDFFMYLN